MISSCGGEGVVVDEDDDELLSVMISADATSSFGFYSFSFKVLLSVLKLSINEFIFSFVLSYIYYYLLKSWDLFGFSYCFTLDFKCCIAYCN